VDEDINIQDPHDVEYALAMRMEASKDLFIIPGARTHEYVRVSDHGQRAKVGIDATVPIAEKERFARAPFRTVDVGLDRFSADAADTTAWLKN
jgi:2,5-furandicarboxylate decarboxylase 1